MGIPDYQGIMLPSLKIFPDQQEHSLREAIEILAGIFKLSDDKRKELLPSGSAFVFDNRVGWAVLYLKKASFHCAQLLWAALRMRNKRSLIKTRILQLDFNSVDPNNVFRVFCGLAEFPRYKLHSQFQEELERNNE